MQGLITKSLNDVNIFDTVEYMKNYLSDKIFHLTAKVIKWVQGI